MDKAIYNEILILTCLSNSLTVAARGTYEAGTENVLKPSVLRAYNEVQHRITAAIRDRLKGKEAMSVNSILEMLDILGKKYGEVSNIDFFVKESYRCSSNF